MFRILIPLLLAVMAPLAWGADWFAPDNWKTPDMTVSSQLGAATFDNGGPLALSVEQAVALALTNNPSLIAQKQAPIIAGTFAAVERAVFDPTLFAQAQQAEDETYVEAGLSKKLPTGTTLQLTLAQDFDDAPRDTDLQAGLTLTQALLDGFGIATNLVSLRQARTQVAASAYQLRGFVTALVADVESTYWQYLGARARIDILHNALELAEQQAQATEARIAAGAVAEIQRYAFAAEAAQRRQDLINGRAKARQLRTQLLRLITAPDQAAYQRKVKPTSTVKVEQTAPIDVSMAYVKLAWQRRADLNQARLAKIRNQLEVVATQNGLLPRLDFFARLSRNGFGDDAGNQPGVGDTYDLTAGLQFEYTLGNRAAEARAQRAQATRVHARAAIDNLQRVIAAEVRSAVIEVQRAAAQIDASAATVRLREQTLKAERARFKVGRSTALLVAQAQRDLLTARLNHLDAYISYRLALINLHVADGSLLTRRLIDAPGARSPALPWAE